MASTKGSKSKKKTSGTAAGGKKRSVQTVPQTKRVQERPERQKSSPEIQREAVLWMVLAFSIFAFISYLGIGGFVGSVISDISFGLFGILAYLLPFLVFLAAAFLISNKGNRIVGFKLASATGLYLCLCSLMELMVNGYQPEIRITKLYSDSAALKTGGGAVGGAVCSLLCPALGTIGAGIVLVILTIVCLVILTQKSLMAGMRSQGKRVYNSAQASRTRRQEMRQREQQMEAPFFDEDAVMIPQEPEQPRETWTATSSAGRRKKTLSRRERTKAAREQERMQNEEPAGEGSLEIPVIFPSRPQKRRMDHRVSGITSNTTLEDERRAAAGKRTGSRRRSSGAARDGGRADVSAGMRSRTAISAASMVNQQKDSRKASVSVFPGREETCYINLDAPQTDQRETGVSAEMDTQRPDDFLPNVRIRGLEQEEPERAEDDYVSPEEASQNVQNHARESDEDVYIPWEEPEETVNQSIDLESEIRWYEDGQKEVTDSVMRKQEDTDDSVKPQRDASDFAVCKQEDTGSSVEPQRDASDFAVHKQEDNGSADAVRPAAEHVRQSAETSASKTPETRKSAASAWDGIWADETDVSRGGTSGTVFRDERRPGSSRSEKQMVSREDTDGDESQVQPAGSDSGGHIKKNPRSSQQEIEDGIASVEAEAAKAAEVVKPEYVFPPLDLLKKGKNKNNSSQEQEIRKTAAKLQQTLDSFGVRVTVTDVSCGPSVTRYELQPEQGVKVSRIVSLADDIKLNLAAADIRIEAPIPGKAAVGIEVPNAENSAVMLRDLLESEEFQNHPSHLAFATGKDIGGKPVVSDIAKMPHLLIAGATGSGKSVCINTLIMSILYKADPEDVKLIMIDPKVVELSVYNGIPHLFIPVVTDPKKAAGALNWGVAEMTDRYNKFAEFGVRNLKGYNEKIEAMGLTGEDAPKKLPQIVIIVDELADLMMVAPGEVEDSICRLAQLARAAGIHLIIATQRPSVNVITGLIKANMPSRIAFSVSSSVDSRTIIDMGGAEKLLGKGDMLFYPQGYQKPERVQGAFVSDEEVADVVDFLKNKNVSEAYSTEMEQQMAKVQQAVATSKMADDTDALFAEAGKFIIEKDKASIGMLQRVFKIGFNRAARIMDQLSDAGVVGPEEGTKPRKVLMTLEEFENTLE